jgi:hypothetical protein
MASNAKRRRCQYIQVDQHYRLLYLEDLGEALFPISEKESMYSLVNRQCSHQLDLSFRVKKITNFNVKKVTGLGVLMSELPSKLFLCST